MTKSKVVPIMRCAKHGDVYGPTCWQCDFDEMVIEKKKKKPKKKDKE